MSFPRYPKYKPSGVEWLGQVPEHWKVLPIKRSFHIVGGSTPKSETESFWDGDILWATPSDLSKRESIYISDTQRRISAAGLASCAATLVPMGSIILSTRAPIGSLAIAATAMCTNQGCKSLVPVEGTDTNYFAYLLSTSSTELNIRGKGTTFLELSADELGAFKTPAPPITEQTQIASFLDRETAKIDKLVTEQQRLIDRLKEKRQAVISNAVTKGLNPDAPMKSSGIEWLGDVPAHWCVERGRFLFRKLDILPQPEDDVVTAFRDGQVTLRTNRRTEGFTFAVLEVGYQRVQVGDLVIHGMDAFAGAIGVSESTGKCTPEYSVMTPARLGVDNSYFATILRLMAQRNFILVICPSVRERAPRFRFEAFKDVSLPVPPLAEQQEIVRLIESVDEETTSLTTESRRAIDLLEERRTALISAAVTGQIDVSERVVARSRMSLHKEISFETEICQHLKVNGWFYAEADAASYDRARALFPSDVGAWVQDAQPAAWETLTKNHGAQAREVLLTRLRDQIDQRGALDVLRHGIELLGLKQPLKLAEFKPALAINPEILARYDANRLRVVRQVRYSLHNENCLDLVLFLNGVPVATVELKTDFTQSIDDAVDQYRFDRHPRPKGHAPEPLLSFPRGALVHFAVSNSEVRMVTRLDGTATAFLPFNQGDDGGAGNPVNPKGGHRTAYLWEQVWQRDSWMEIIGRYLIAQRNDKKQIDRLIFPRFHQLDVTRKLQTAVLADGPGAKYLVQHSAGSGKTNSIAWTAHFLAELHDAQSKKIFDSVLVVSDRTVIDSQLQEALFDFQRTTGVVATITNKEGSKSAKLAEALSGDKKIVVCTIQTFPFALEAVRELAATEGKRFAVIADEAHSSQSGEAAAKLKAVLSAEEMKELEDGGEVSAEDILAAQMAARAADSGITFVAFTATPKAKTMELFGTRPDPAKPAGPGNLPAPFHVYSMRQAIEEGFILDVLQNYITYKLAFRLAHGGTEYDDRMIERSAALKRIMGWVKLHPYNISQKVEIVVEHFRSYVAPLLNDKAKGMVVVGSRVEAVRWQLAIDKYVKARGYKIGTLVAFSGEVTDKELGPDPFTENSKSLNPGLKGRDIREAFKGDDYRILLVANKFQTGFDQPLLCGMYVDKRLAGIQAVQTLSRLNRAFPGKDTTYVVDFINEAEEVLTAFRAYYTTAELADVTDPNLVFDLRAKLDGAGHYDSFEVDRVIAAELDPKSKQSDLVKALEPVTDRLLKKYKAGQGALEIAAAKNDEQATEAAQNALESLALFKADMGAFVRLYTFLSQVFDYGNTDIEKRAIFYRRLLPLLEFGRERDSIDVSKVVLTHHTLKNLGQRPMPLGGGEKPVLDPITETGSGSIQDKEKALLEEIIERVNDLFEGDLTDQDKLVYVNNVIKGKLLESETLRQQAINNTKEQFANSPDLNSELINAIMGALDAHSLMSTQALNSPSAQDGLKDILLNHAQLWETLRDRSSR